MYLQWNTIFLIYLKLFFVSCARNSSLTFVIDDTLSMYDDIEQVRLAAAEIMNIVKREKTSEIEDVVLVTFNDPDVILREKTADKDTLIQALSDITVHNRRNHDCPEYALSGIEKALEESRPASYLFVFTDASAKDHHKVNRVISLCEKKQSQVVFVLTGDCHHAQTYNYKVYHNIAKACNGQVFRVLSNEVQDVLETIKETIKGQKTVVTSKVLPASVLWNPVPFTVDDQSEYVIVSTSGRQVHLIIKDSSTNRDNDLRVNKIMWKSSGKVVKFDAPKPGTYYAWVKADSDISIIVYARSDFSFNHGFSSFVPKSLEDTSKQPIKGERHHLSITVEDPNHTVDIKYADILNMEEQVIDNLPLKKVKENFYISEKFVSPSSTFKIQVTGINKNTRNVIKRFARTNVDPQDPPEPDFKSPEVIITEGLKVNVDYAGEILLTCKVSAYPKPDIVWTSDNGAILSSNSNLVEKPYDYISYLKLSNVKKTGRYYCKASNNLARNVMAKIHVEPKNPLKAIQLPTETSIAQFGKEKKIVCYVYSPYPLEIKWKVPLKPSDYSVSDDYKVLTIKAVTMDAQGMYTCETSLKSDPKVKITATTTLTIGDLAPPAILNTAGQVTGKFGDHAQIACKIKGGVPPPIVTWQVMKKGDQAFNDILAQGEELIMNALALEDSGRYRCIAKNPLGQTEKTIELIVTKIPEAVIQKGPSISFSYGSTNEITCKVSGNPLPGVVWKNSKGNKLKAYQNIETHYEITSSVRITNVKNPDTYYCYAGKAVSKIDIDVTSPFVVIGRPPASINSKYGENTDIVCDIQSKFPMEIIWFYQSASIKTKRTKIQTSDIYTISSDEKTLRILSTNLKNTGTYTCAATLKSDKNQRVAFTTNIGIADLSPPELKDTDSKVSVNYKDAASLPCKIVRGTPLPTIGWQVKYKGDSGFRSLTGSGQELIIPSVTLENAGQYRCTARNDIGQKTKDTELVVNKVPETSIDKGSSITVPYDSSNELKCTVIAYPQPIIVWKNSKGHNLLAKDMINQFGTVSILNLTNARSSETYSCSADNNKGTAVSSIHVKVSRAIAFPNQSTEITGVNFGSPADIKCEATSAFPMKIKWFYQKNDHPSYSLSEIHTSDKYKISSDGKMLRIISTDLDLVGTYTCEASLVSDENEKGTQTKKVKINDLKAPEIFVGEKTITVMKGQSLSTSCRVIGVPKPTVTWQFKARDSDTFVPLTTQGVQITNTGYSSAGTYMCIATNAVGRHSETVDIIVHGKPEITNVDSVYYGVKGDKVLKVPCEVTGVPEPSVVWKQGGKFVTSDWKITVNKKSLYLNNPTAKDSSNFSCEATNKYGSATTNLQVDISDFIEPIKVKSRYIYLKLGESTEDITCDLPTHGPSSIRWYVNTELSAVKSKTYSLQNANFSNDGNYTCRVNTDQGSESLNYVVDVGFLPSFIRPSTSPKYWNGNKKDILDCNADAKPEGNTVWHFNGNEVHNNVPELFITGWGRYTCNVTNVHGSVQQTFDVTSLGCIVNRTVDNKLRNTPLLINDKDATWPELKTENEFYILDRKQTINIQCVTKKNAINTFKIQPKANKITVECYKEDQFIVDGNKYKFEDLQCKEYVMPSFEFTNKPCMKNGEVIEVGFALDSGFLSAYDVCYEQNNDKTLYTKVLMSNQNLGNRVDPSFKVDTELSNVGPFVKCQYNKRRLVNPMDMPFGPAQAATLSKYNSVPVFEPCDGSSRKSWSAVEEFVSLVLEYDIESFTVWTGASEYDAAGVPRYLWKVLKFDDNVETIVFVNARDAHSDDIRCSKHDNDVLGNQLTDEEDQYMYACKEDEFMKGFDVSIDKLIET